MVKHGYLLFGGNTFYKLNVVYGKDRFCTPTIKLYYASGLLHQHVLLIHQQLGHETCFSAAGWPCYYDALIEGKSYIVLFSFWPFYHHLSCNTVNGN